VKIPLHNFLSIAFVQSTQHLPHIKELARKNQMREKTKCIIWEQNVKKKKSKIFQWIDSLFWNSFAKLKNEGKRLNKNQELHWWNWFEEIFGPLKVLSLGALVFRRARGKCFFSAFRGALSTKLGNSKRSQTHLFSLQLLALKVGSQEHSLCAWSFLKSL
jgi:hypothetical protein